MPVLVRDGEVKEMMLKEPAIHEALENAAKVNLAFVGIGNTSSSASIVRAGYIGQAELSEFSSKGAVGDILMRYYGVDGRYIPMSFEDRTISLEWEQILRLPMVVALAFGPDKIAAICGALAGEAIHGLVTDRQTAISLLELDRRLPQADSPLS
jgi:DNA-binding transcriptional regulator LsrR (DeoR family)